MWTCDVPGCGREICYSTEEHGSACVAFNSRDNTKPFHCPACVRKLKEAPTVSTIANSALRAAQSHFRYTLVYSSQGRRFEGSFHGNSCTVSLNIAFSPPFPTCCSRHPRCRGRALRISPGSGESPSSISLSVRSLARWEVLHAAGCTGWREPKERPASMSAAKPATQSKLKARRHPLEYVHSFQVAKRPNICFIVHLEACEATGRFCYRDALGEQVQRHFDEVSHTFAVR